MLSFDPFTISKSVLEAGEATAIQFCWIQEHRKVLIWEVSRKIKINQQWQVQSITDRTAEIQDLVLTLTKLCDMKETT